MRNREEEPVEWVEGREYTARELETLADTLLREDSRSELCRDCDERGDETGFVRYETDKETVDAAGTPLTVAYPEFRCANGHMWFLGEGAVRGIGGDNPILFEEHFHSRKRREIYCKEGVPDPNIVSGIYNRTHPAGRKVNSPDQRKKNGASYYR